MSDSTSCITPKYFLWDSPLGSMCAQINKKNSFLVDFGLFIINNYSRGKIVRKSHYHILITSYTIEKAVEKCSLFAGDYQVTVRLS